MSSPQRWQLLPATSSKPRASYLDPPGFVQSAALSTNKKGGGNNTGASNAKSSSSNAASSSASSAATLNTLRQQRAWDLALGPAKAVPMQAFMVYMSGGGVQIFSLMIVFQLIKGAISGISSVNQTFESLERQSAAAPAAGSSKPSPSTASPFMNQKVVHCLAQCLLLALGLYKCHTMGLLPTHDSDWLAFKKQPIPTEVSEVSLGGWWQQ